MTTTIPAPESIMDRLKEETAKHHAVAEAKPLEGSLLGGTISDEHYRQYLAQRWVIHRALEAATDEALARDPRLGALDLPPLYQTANLEEDLAHAGVDIAGIKPLPGAGALLALIRNAESVAPLMGIYYVFEGSKNGARFIARSLGRAWGRSDGAGLKYFNPHGDSQRELWQKFRADMNAIEWDAQERDQMVEAAKVTFETVTALADEIQAA